MHDFKLSAFAPIVNVTGGSRRIKGVLTLEVADKKNGWVFDYEGSKKYFQEYFNEIHNSTEGKSYGNIRLMHTNRVVGKIIEEPIFNDASKTIEAVIEISEDSADDVWKDIQNGLYSGLSFSGIKMPPSKEDLARWANLSDGNQRYVARPFETSVVDNPNQPGAYFSVANSVSPSTFTYVNENGEAEERPFQYLENGTSTSTIARFAEYIGNLKYEWVGDEELQKKFDSWVSSGLGLLVKMAKSQKADHKEMTTSTQEMMATANSAVVEEGEEMTPEEIQNAATAAIAPMQEATIQKVQTMLDAFKTEVMAQVTTVSNSVSAVKTQMETLSKTPEETSVVTNTAAGTVTPTTTTSTAPVLDFVNIENCTGQSLTDGDKKALELINSLTFSTK